MISDNVRQERSWLAIDLGRSLAHDLILHTSVKHLYSYEEG